MKRVIPLLLLVFLIGCQIQGGAVFTQSPAINKITLATDRDLYHSNEIIQITSNIESQTDLSNASVHFYGIYARTYRLDHTINSDLAKGENTISFNYTAPKCYGCAGVQPGMYQITAEVIYNNASLENTTIDIELRQ